MGFSCLCTLAKKEQLHSITIPAFVLGNSELFIGFLSGANPTIFEFKTTTTPAL
jgi:hypothetical protein